MAANPHHGTGIESGVDGGAGVCVMPVYSEQCTVYSEQFR
jgi:hypothetical protein